MTLNSLGDMAQAFALSRRNTEIKSDIQRLNLELSSGQTTDITRHLGGSYARLTAVERDIRLNAAYGMTIAEADQFVTAVQDRLEQISTLATDFTADLLAAQASHDAVTRDALTSEARMHFRTIVAALNSQSAGRVMFGGETTDRAALQDADTILAALEATVLGAADADEAIARIATWFDDPAGYDTVAYAGSGTPLGAFKMSDVASVAVDVRATDPAIKSILKGFAIASFATAPVLAFSSEEQGRMVRAAGESLLTDHGQLVNLQATLGLAQQEVDRWSAYTASERVSFDMAKGALLNIDPYRSATELEAAQFQLESLYTVTVRLSQLSLVNFLR